MRLRLGVALRAWVIGSLAGCAALFAAVMVSGSNAHAAAATQVNQNQDPPRLEQRRDAPQTTFDEVSSTVMCPSCDTTLDQSESPAAQRMRAWVVAAVDAGWTQAEIRDGLVEEYGGDESVLATPRARGIGLAVWIVPALIALGALGIAWFSLRRWRRDALRRRGTGSSHRAGATGCGPHVGRLRS